MERTDNVFFEAVSGLVEQIAGLADDNLCYFESITDNIINDRMTDLHTIERNLDTMLSYCFDDRILTMYKAILRKLFYKHPETVKCYVDAYYMMYGDDGGDGA